LDEIPGGFALIQLSNNKPTQQGPFAPVNPSIVHILLVLNQQEWISKGSFRPVFFGEFIFGVARG
jgi:hypothetical protein